MRGVGRATASEYYSVTEHGITFHPSGAAGKLHVMVPMDHDTKLIVKQALLACCVQWDDPEFDGTDGAHPAWWRGNDAGVAAAVRVLHGAMESGKAPQTGCSELNELGALCCKLYALRAELTRSRELVDAVVRPRFWVVSTSNPSEEES